MVTMSTAPKIWTRETGLVEKRDLWTAMKRGFRGRCPRCGEGKLFRAFLKTALYHLVLNHHMRRRTLFPLPDGLAAPAESG